MTDFDISALAGEIDAGTFGTDSGIPAPATTPSIDMTQEYSYQARGKEVKEPLETILKRASMGYDYAQLVQQHKQRESEMLTREQVLKESEGKWKSYDEYANQNPQWADFVKTSWESRFNQQNAGQPTGSQADTNGMHPELVQKLGKIDQFMDQIQAKEKATAQAEADLALNSEVESVQKQFPDMDLKKTDAATGESMEMAVLKHAQLYGINSFEAAFKHLYFDQLVSRAALKAKEDASKTMQSNVKKGFLGTSSESMVKPSNPAAIKGRSYHEMMDQAAKEFGFT